MRVHDCNWQMLEAYLARDDRLVLPIGSKEQHGYLSVVTDAHIPARVGGRSALREGVLARLVDGELPVDAPAGGDHAERGEAAHPADRHPSGAAGRAAPPDRRRQLWRLV